MAHAQRPVALYAWTLTLVFLALVSPLVTDAGRPHRLERDAFHAIAVTTTTAIASAVTTSSTPQPPTTSVPPTETTTTTRSCRDSFDIACGAFRWDPQPPPNQPGAAQIIVVPPKPKPGERVTFQIIATDPDNPFVPARCGVYSKTNFGDGAIDTADCYRGAVCREAHGPWTPPAPDGEDYTLVRDHTYAATGTYVVAFDVLSNRYGVSLQGTNPGPGNSTGACVDPYASAIHTEVTVNVTTSGMLAP